MPIEKTQLIAHPVRSRILTALLGRQLTALQVGQLLPDVPLSSIYRHVRLLAEGGIIAPVDEVRVNGTATKVYAVQKERARIAPAEVKDATPAEHLTYFATFLNALGGLHRAYLEMDDADPTRDSVHALMTPLYLSPDDYPEFMRRLLECLEPWQQAGTDSNRRRVVFAHAMIPDLPDVLDA